MKISSAFFCAASLCACVAQLCGCGTREVPAAGAPHAEAVSSMPARWRNVPENAQRDRGPSWISPDAKKNDLLYVSDVGTGDVYVYSYPGGKLRGTLTGFSRPSGLCVDKAGDLFVTDLTASKIFEYRHGAEKAMRVLKDPGEEPGDCAVDPTTGNLAVSNVSTPYTGAGDVVLYARAHGKPKAHRDRQIFFYFFCAYDDSGNLYVDGAQSGGFQFAELPAGQSAFTDISLDQTISFGGAVQWDGNDIAVGDYDSNVIYQFRIAGSVGTTVGKTKLDNSNFAIGYWLQGTRVVGANDDGGSVMYWPYPAGGSQTKTIGGLRNPWGSAVSLAK